MAPPPPSINSRKQHRKRRSPLIRNDESLAVKSVRFIGHAGLLSSTRFEQEYCDLTQVEVDKMLCFMRHVAAKIPPNNAMPSGVELLVELLEGIDKYLLTTCSHGTYTHRS